MNDFRCQICGSSIEHDDDGAAISGCPHHNNGRRGFIRMMKFNINVWLKIQYDPNVNNDGCWAASMNGLHARGNTPQEAADNVAEMVARQ